MLKKILLVDDEKNVRELVRATLETEEYVLFEATDGREAVELAQREVPDVMVMDWMMPRMNGIEATRAIRAEPRTAAIPVILLTARSQAEDFAAGKAAGVNAYLVKPFSPFELLERVESLLEEDRVVPNRDD
jgi:two-component system, OmpR family, phosphate regulon response regulator PhoB